MSENQTVEYKQIWRDEFLKWICGFANADMTSPVKSVIFHHYPPLGIS